MEFVDASGTRYQLTETSEAPAPAKETPLWPWVVGGLALAGGLVWMAASSPQKANPISLDLEALVAEARDPATPFGRLEELVEHPEEDVRRAVLDNPNLVPTQEDGKINTSLLEKLAKEFPEEVAVHPLFVLHALVEPTDEMDVVVHAVVKRITDIGLIELLFRMHASSLELRGLVSKNPNTPANILHSMCDERQEQDSYVRQNVAINPNTMKMDLVTLGNDSSFYVRESVARNPRTPVVALRKLGNSSSEPEPSVRMAVIENPNTPEDVLRILADRNTESHWNVLSSALVMLYKRGFTR